MQNLLRKVMSIVFALFVFAVWANTVTADTFCADVQKIIAQSGEFKSLKGEPAEGERFKATTQITGFRQCTVTPFGNTFSYTCETAPNINQAAAMKQWTELKTNLEQCLTGDWLQREAGKHIAFFADRKKGEALSLGLREVAGFKRIGNQLKTFPTHYNRLSVFPRKQMKKKKTN